MKKSTKALSAILSLSSVASVVAPVTTLAATTSIDTLIATAQKTKSFADYMKVYDAYAKLSAADKTKYQAKFVAVYNGVVQMKEINALLDREAAFAKSENVADFYAILADVEKTVKNAADVSYLKGELAKWGNAMLVRQPNYVPATDALIKAQAAWTSATKNVDAIKTAIADAKTAAAKVTHVENNKWLVAEIAKVETALATYEASLSPKVTSVTAINGLTLEVKFNKELNEASAETISKYTFNGSALVGTPELQSDKKTVKITFNPSNKLLTNNPAILKIDGITTVTGSTVDKYEQIFNFTDSAAATLTSVEYVTNASAKINFSEPMSSIATADVKVFDGANEVSGTFLASATAAGDTSLTINTGSLDLNKTYTVKIYNARDLYSNFGGTLTTTITKTTQDTTKPEVVSVESIDLDSIKVNFSEKVITDQTTASNGYGDITIGTLTAKMYADGTNVATVTPSSDGKSVTIDLTTTGKSAAGITGDGLKTVSVNNFFDASGNKQTTAWTKVTNIAADGTAPTVTKTEVSGNKLYLTFSENVTLSTASDDLTSVKYVKNFVEYTPTSVSDAFALYDADGDGSTNTIVLDLTTNSYAEGNYTATLAAATVKDAAGLDNASASVAFNYTPTTSTDKPSVVDGDSNALTGASGISQSGKTVTVVFDKDVDSTTALTASNYLVDGDAAFTSAIFVGNEHTVRLTLKADAVKADATYLFTVQNVKSKVGSVMDKVVFTQTLAETVAPTIKTAVLTAANQVTLTFSESVSGIAAADFELYVDGTKIGTISAVSANSGTSTVLTLPTTLTSTDLAKNIQVKVVSGAAIVDGSAAANALAEGGLVTVTK